MLEIRNTSTTTKTAESPTVMTLTWHACKLYQVPTLHQRYILIISYINSILEMLMMMK